MIAIIGGTGLIKSLTFKHLNTQRVATQYGEVQVLMGDRFIFIQRHGRTSETPPHKINYKANIAAIRDLGISKIIAANSTGSLKPHIHPGTVVIPDDYFNLFDNPTFFDQKMKFTIPGLDDDLRNTLIDSAESLGIEVVAKGVYCQTRGPILETPAEIRFLKQIGDVVGMTMAKEAILAKELDIGYASLCMVDNYANGITDKPLTLGQIHTNVKENLLKVELILKTFMDRCE